MKLDDKEEIKALCGKSDDEYLHVGDDLYYEGGTDLHNVVRFINDGCVYSIFLLEIGAGYKICVDSQGPKKSGTGHLRFTDENGHQYSLKIIDSTRKIHTVYYKSEKPNITKVEWSDKSIK